MSKPFFSAVIGLSVLVLGGCVEPAGQSTSASAPVPLTSEQIRTQIAGNTVIGKSGSGRDAEIYFTPSLKAKFTNSSSANDIQYELLKNGIICTNQPSRRFCYRVYLTGDRVLVTYADGTPEFTGRLVPGNALSS